MTIIIILLLLIIIIISIIITIIIIIIIIIVIIIITVALKGYQRITLELPCSVSWTWSCQTFLAQHAKRNKK